MLGDGGVSNDTAIGDMAFAPVRGVTIAAGTGAIADLSLLWLADGEPEGAVVFAADASGWFALDYRSDPDHPGVLHWSEYEDEPIRLVETFREFLGRLAE